MEKTIMPKNNYDKIVTPIGVSQYAWLTKPDTQFDPDGHYKVNLILDTDKAQDVINKIEANVKKAMANAKEKVKGKAVKAAPTPYFEQLDESDELTGKTVFKFKTKAQITTKDGTLIPNRVALFDSAGVPLTDANVWSGSEMKVSAELIPYYTAMAGAGVSLRLRAVQITKLVEGGSGNAKGYGFGEEDGYKLETFENVSSDETVSEEDF